MFWTILINWNSFCDQRSIANMLWEVNGDHRSIRGLYCKERNAVHKPWCLSFFYPRGLETLMDMISSWYLFQAEPRMQN